MANAIPNPEVDFFFDKAKSWQEEMVLLRRIALDSGLTETLKWGAPCYMQDERNVVLIHAFKGYCALLFFKGALLKDAKALLVQQTENVQAARQLRFTGLPQVRKQEGTIRAYIREAAEIERSGKKVPLKKTAAFPMPEEFAAELAQHPQLKTAFEALTPGRQRAYLLHFSAPKQSKTRMARIEKCRRPILEGRGLNDR